MPGDARKENIPCGSSTYEQRSGMAEDRQPFGLDQKEATGVVARRLQSHFGLCALLAPSQ